MNFDREYADNADFIARYVRNRIGDTSEVDDVVQEAFLRLAIRLRQGVDERWHTRKWLCVVGRNLCTDELRRRSSRLLSEAETVLALDDDGAIDAPFLRLEAIEGDPDHTLELKQMRERMDAAGRQLSEVDRTLLTMRELHGMSYATMGQRLGKSNSAVETALFRARHHFQDRYRALEASA